MILMKPIHNKRRKYSVSEDVVIPHKVNDFNETNSQLRNNLKNNQPSCDSSQS